MNDTQHDDDLDFDLSDDEAGTEQAERTEPSTTEPVGEAGADGNAPAEQNDTPTEAFGNEAPTVLTDEEKAAKVEADKAEAKAKAEAEEKERAEALEVFKTHVNSLFDHADYDRATGVLPEVLNQGVIDEYAKLPGAKGKAAGRAWLEESMQESMVKGTTDGPDYFMKARTFMELNTKVTAAKAARQTAAAKPKVDPTEAHVERIAAMLLAPNLVPVAADVEDGWAEKAEALVADLAEDTAKYRDWLAKKDEPVAEGETALVAPEVNPVVIAAAKIAQGRAAGSVTRKASTGGTSTPRTSTAGSGHTGDIAKHLREAMDTVGVGEFMTIAQIVNVETSQYGGSAPKPSPGAVAARLFPAKGECSIDFVRPEGKDEGHPVKGAVRIA